MAAAVVLPELARVLLRAVSPRSAAAAAWCRDLVTPYYPNGGGQDCWGHPFVFLRTGVLNSRGPNGLDEGGAGDDILLTTNDVTLGVWALAWGPEFAEGCLLMLCLQLLTRRFPAARLVGPYLFGGVVGVALMVWMSKMPAPPHSPALEVLEVLKKLVGSSSSRWPLVLTVGASTGFLGVQLSKLVLWQADRHPAAAGEET